MGEIYIIKNTINNKCYIGQTIQTSEIRFQQHLKLSKSNSSQLIYKAIKKYGKDCFYYETLETGIDVENLDSREEYWISFYNTYNNGYNLTKGGKQSRNKKYYNLLENKEEIIRMYKTKKYSISKLSELYNSSKRSISNLLKAQGIVIIKRNKNNINLTEDEKVRISNLYKIGKNTKEIAERFNINEKTARRYKNYN